MNVKVERNEERDNNDAVLIAVYDDTGKLLAMDCADAEFTGNDVQSV